MYMTNKLHLALLNIHVSGIGVELEVCPWRRQTYSPSPQALSICGSSSRVIHVESPHFALA